MIPQEEPLVFNSNEDVPSPTIEEVRNAIQRIKKNKSAGAGSDGIRESLTAGINFIDAFHQLLVKIWNAVTMPNEWNQSIICNARTIEESVFLILPRRSCHPSYVKG